MDVIQLKMDMLMFNKLSEYADTHYKDAPVLYDLKKLLDSKARAMELRDLYSRSKTATTQEEKDFYYAEYLNLRQSDRHNDDISDQY